MDNDEILFIVQAEVDKAIADMQRAQNEAKKTEQAAAGGISVFGDYGDSMSKAGESGNSALSPIPEVITAVSSSVSAGILVFDKIKNTIRDVAAAVTEFYDDYADAEYKGVAFNAVMENSNRITSAGAEELRRYAGELSDLTGADDDAILSMESYLVASGRNTKETENLLKAASNLSVITGQDLRSAMEQLNATYSGTPGRLVKVNSAFGELSAEELKNGAAIDLVNKKYTGLAESVSESSQTIKERWKTTWGNFKEEVGGLIAPVVNDVLEKLTDFVSNATKEVRKIGAVFTNFPAIAQDTFALILEIIRSAFSWNSLKIIFTSLVEYIIRTFAAGISTIPKLFTDVLNLLVTPLKTFFSWVGDSISKLLSFDKNQISQIQSPGDLIADIASGTVNNSKKIVNDAVSAFHVQADSIKVLGSNMAHIFDGVNFDAYKKNMQKYFPDDNINIPSGNAGGYDTGSGGNNNSSDEKDTQGYKTVKALYDTVKRFVDEDKIIPKNVEEVTGFLESTKTDLAYLGIEDLGPLGKDLKGEAETLVKALESSKWEEALAQAKIESGKYLSEREDKIRLGMESAPTTDSFGNAIKPSTREELDNDPAAQKALKDILGTWGDDLAQAKAESGKYLSEREDKIRLGMEKLPTTDFLGNAITQSTEEQLAADKDFQLQLKEISGKAPQEKIDKIVSSNNDLESIGLITKEQAQTNIIESIESEIKTLLASGLSVNDEKVQVYVAKLFEENVKLAGIQASPALAKALENLPKTDFLGNPKKQSTREELDNDPEWQKLLQSIRDTYDSQLGEADDESKKYLSERTDKIRLGMEKLPTTDFLGNAITQSTEEQLASDDDLQKQLKDIYDKSPQGIIDKIIKSNQDFYTAGFESEEQAQSNTVDEIQSIISKLLSSGVSVSDPTVQFYLDKLWDESIKLANIQSKPYVAEALTNKPKTDFLGNPIDKSTYVSPDNNQVIKYLQQFSLIGKREQVQTEDGGFTTVLNGGTEIGNLLAGLTSIETLFTAGAASLAQMLLSIDSVQKVLNPISTMLTGVKQVLEPLINEALDPLVTVLVMLGQVIGTTLSPIFSALGTILKPVADLLKSVVSVFHGFAQIIATLRSVFLQLSPVILIITTVLEAVASAFTWFYNSVIMPVGNAIIGVANGIINGINTALGWLGVHINNIKSMTTIEEMSVDQETVINDKLSEVSSTLDAYTSRLREIYDQQIESLKNLLDLGLISESDYQSQVDALNDKYAEVTDTETERSIEKLTDIETIIQRIEELQEAKAALENGQNVDVPTYSDTSSGTTISASGGNTAAAEEIIATRGEEGNDEVRRRATRYAGSAATRGRDTDGGDVYVNVTVAGSVVTEQDLQENIASGVAKQRRRGMISD